MCRRSAAFRSLFCIALKPKGFTTLTVSVSNFVNHHRQPEDAALMHCRWAVAYLQWAAQRVGPRQRRCIVHAVGGVVRVQPGVAQRDVGGARLHSLLPRLPLQPAQLTAQRRYWSPCQGDAYQPRAGHTCYACCCCEPVGLRIHRDMCAHVIEITPGPEDVMVGGGTVRLWRAAGIPRCVHRRGLRWRLQGKYI
jgi:hypothetical protein